MQPRTWCSGEHGESTPGTWESGVEGVKGACKGEERLVEGKAADVKHTEVFASTLIVTTCCKGRVTLYFIIIFSCFLKLFSQPRAFTPYYPKRCKTSSVGQSAGLLILRSSVRFRQKLKKTEKSNLHGFEVPRPSNKGTKLLLQVIKAIINQPIS